MRILLPSARPAIALAGIVVAALALSEVGVPTFLRARTYAAAVFARLGGVDFAPAEALLLALPVLALTAMLLVAERWKIGRTTRRESVCMSVEISLSSIP